MDTELRIKSVSICILIRKTKKPCAPFYANYGTVKVYMD